MLHRLLGQVSCSTDPIPQEDRKKALKDGEIVQRFVRLISSVSVLIARASFLEKIESWISSKLSRRFPVAKETAMNQHKKTNLRLRIEADSDFHEFSIGYQSNNSKELGRFILAIAASVIAALIVAAFI